MSFLFYFAISFKNIIFVYFCVYFSKFYFQHSILCVIALWCVGLAFSVAWKYWCCVACLEEMLKNDTVKQVNFLGSLILQKSQIREIKLPGNCKFYIDTNGKFPIFAKLSVRKNSNNFQFVRKKIGAKLTCFTVSESSVFCCIVDSTDQNFVLIPFDFVCNQGRAEDVWGRCSTAVPGGDEDLINRIPKRSTDAIHEWEGEGRVNGSKSTIWAKYSLGRTQLSSVWQRIKCTTRLHMVGLFHHMLDKA